MIRFFKASIASAIFFACMVFGQSHEYYQSLISHYHQDASLALDGMNINTINGAGWLVNYHGVVNSLGGVGDYGLFINAELAFYSDQTNNQTTFNYWASLMPLPEPFNRVKSEFTNEYEPRKLIQEHALADFSETGNVQELFFIDQKAQFKMLYTRKPLVGWEYHTLSCKKLDENKIELNKETLICKVIEPSSGAYTEYWILERAQYS